RRRAALPFAIWLDCFFCSCALSSRTAPGPAESLAVPVSWPICLVGVGMPVSFCVIGFVAPLFVPEVGLPPGLAWVLGCMSLPAPVVPVACAIANPQLPANNAAANISFVSFRIGCLLSLRHAH